MYQVSTTKQLLIRFGREVCSDLAAGLWREWLVTNGLGGYASGTLAGVNMRCSNASAVSRGVGFSMRRMSGTACGSTELPQGRLLGREQRTIRLHLSGPR